MLAKRSVTPANQPRTIDAKIVAACRQAACISLAGKYHGLYVNGYWFASVALLEVWDSSGVSKATTESPMAASEKVGNANTKTSMRILASLRLMVYTNPRILEKHGTKFVTDPNRMRDANYQLNRDWNEDPSARDWNDDGSMFCSQLVASGLQKIGLLDPIRPSANYTPHDLSNEEETTSLFLKRGAKISRKMTRLLEVCKEEN